MDDQWWFQSLGEEFGPLSFDDLIAAARGGTLAGTDLVRHGQNGDWKQASTFDLPFVSIGASAKSGWMVSIRGEVLGPFSTKEIASMIRDGRLTNTDSIRRRHSEAWHQVAQIAGDRHRHRAKAGNILHRATSSAVTNLGADDLEKLILDVLSVPQEITKPSLAELGMASDEARESIPIIQANDPQPQSSPNLSAKQPFATAWSRMNPFRRESAKVPDGMSHDFQERQTAMVRPVRCISSNRESDRDDNPASDHDSHIQQSAFPWLELLITASVLALTLQLFPALARALAYNIDVRHWTFRGVTIGSCVAVATLVLVRVRQSMRRET